MIDAVLGLLGFEGPGALLAMFVGAAAVVFGAWWRGRQSGVTKERERAETDYRDTRREIDDADLGLGATDSQRVDRLREIADRRGASKD